MYIKLKQTNLYYLPINLYIFQVGLNCKPTLNSSIYLSSVTYAFLQYYTIH